MYSCEDRLRAVQLYIKLGKRIGLTIRQLGYPTKNALKTWYREFEQRHELRSGYTRPAKFSQAQKERAVEHYLEHGKCIAATIKSLGYPCRSLLSAWLQELHPRATRVTAKRPTVGEAVAERTAAVIWQMLSQTQLNVFLWNVFPLHPHEPGNPFSNRQHNASERRFGEDALAALIELVRPKRIVCIGNDAYKALDHLQGTIPTVAVRHPSYGGQTQFVAQISALYGIEPRAQRALF